MEGPCQTASDGEAGRIGGFGRTRRYVCHNTFWGWGEFDRVETAAGRVAPGRIDSPATQIGRVLSAPSAPTVVLWL